MASVSPSPLGTMPSFEPVNAIPCLVSSVWSENHFPSSTRKLVSLGVGATWEGESAVLFASQPASMASAPPDTMTVVAAAPSLSASLLVIAFSMRPPFKAPSRQMSARLRRGVLDFLNVKLYKEFTFIFETHGSEKGCRVHLRAKVSHPGT